jgi:hypothetical protein
MVASMLRDPRVVVAESAFGGALAHTFVCVLGFAFAIRRPTLPGSDGSAKTPPCRSPNSA